MQAFSPLIEQAIELAAQWHDRTYRKSRWREAAFEVVEGETLRVPMIAHVFNVAMILQRAGWEDEVVAAAVLHDTLEDPNAEGQYLPCERLAALVGDDVADLARAVTEQKFDEAGNVRSWRARKEDYVAHLEAASVGAVAISLADKLHNLWAINEGLISGLDVFSPGAGRKPLSAGPADQLWFFQAVISASERHSDPRLAPLRDLLREEIRRFTRRFSADQDGLERTGFVEHL